MADLMEQIEAALEKGRIAEANEPRAISAAFDASRNRIVIVLVNDATFEFPPHLAQGLAGATDEQLGDIEILDNGSALHWESLDADFSIPNLLSGIFGTAKWMASFAGSHTSPRKAAAARENGAKGGRPSRADLILRDEAIADIVGSSPLPKAEMVSRVWDHIRKNNLQNPHNKREILADDKLKAVFGKERISMYELGKKLAAIRPVTDGGSSKGSVKVSKGTSRLRTPRKWPGSKKSA